MKWYFMLRRLPILLTCFASLAIAGEVVRPKTGDEFLALRDAFAAGDADKVEVLVPRFNGSLLEPYAAYYRLRLRLATASESEIRAFLARPAETPMVDRLRSDWLKLLGHRQLWDAFAAEYPYVINVDNELACYALQSRQRSQEKEALADARMLWFGNDALADSCIPLIDAAQQAGILSADDVWQRIRTALESGDVALAAEVALRLPAGQAPATTELHRAYKNPARYLAALRLNRNSTAERVAAMFALQRLARQSVPQTLLQWGRMAAYFPENEQHYFYGWLGYEAARSQDERALQWYREARDIPLSPAQRAWRVRAALRKQDWKEVVASVDQMSAEQQRESAWRYWKARALKELGRPQDAQGVFVVLARDYGYYGQLAASELDTPLVSAAPDLHPPELEEIGTVMVQPGIRRALTLYQLDLRTEAAREWDWAVRQYSDRQLLAAAEVARRSGIYDRAINTAERTQQVHDASLRFPVPYRDELQAHVRDNDLDEAWVYGLMRQESRFAPQAKSGAGARGLMQLMPATARWAARQLGLKGYRASLIHELDMNLKLGTFYLKTVLSQFDNNPVLASAGYNAGPIRANQWRAEEPLEGAIYVETIPFDETRNYVKKVMSNTVYYSQLFGQPTMPLKQRLGVVPPREKANKNRARES